MGITTKFPDLDLEFLKKSNSPDDLLSFVAPVTLYPRDQAFEQFSVAYKESQKLYDDVLEQQNQDKEIMKRAEFQTLFFRLYMLLYMPLNKQAQEIAGLCEKLESFIFEKDAPFAFFLLASALSLKACHWENENKQTVKKICDLFDFFGDKQNPLHDLFLARDLARVGLAIFEETSFEYIEKALFLFEKHKDSFFVISPQPGKSIMDEDPKLVVYYFRAMMRKVGYQHDLLTSLALLDDLGSFLDLLIEKTPKPNIKNELQRAWFVHFRVLVHYKAATILQYRLGVPDPEKALKESAAGFRLYRQELEIQKTSSRVREYSINESDDEDAYLSFFDFIEMLQRLKNSSKEFEDISIFETFES